MIPSPPVNSLGQTELKEGASYVDTDVFHALGSFSKRSTVMHSTATQLGLRCGPSSDQVRKDYKVSAAAPSRYTHLTSIFHETTARRGTTVLTK